MAPRKQSPTEWLNALPENATHVRVRVGTGRNLPTVCLVALPDAETSKAGDFEPIVVGSLDELAQRAESEAMAAGWPEDYPTVRFHAYSESGREMRTFQTSQALTGLGQAAGPGGPEWVVIGRLTDGLLSMAGECRRTVHILSETLNHRETMMADALESALASRQDAQDAEVQAYAAQMVAEEALGEEEDSGLAGQILQQVANAVMSNRIGGPLDASGLRDVFDANPDILNDLVEDEDLIGRVVAAYQARKAGEPKEESPGAPVVDVPGDEPDPG